MQSAKHEHVQVPTWASSSFEIWLLSLMRKDERVFVASHVCKTPEPVLTIATHVPMQNDSAD